jgi:hypothetical protein
VVVAVVVLGFLGWRLSLRIGIPEIWAGPHPARSRIIYPALLGLSIGIFWVLTDLFVHREVHASFPGVIPLYTYAAILSEVVSRLFLATFIVWLVSIVVLRGRAVDATYWVVAIVLSLMAAYAQGAATYRTSDGGFFWFDVISAFALAAVVESVAFYLYRRSAILAPLVMHFVFFAVWHMLWGGLVKQVIF